MRNRAGSLSDKAKFMALLFVDITKKKSKIMSFDPVVPLAKARLRAVSPGTIVAAKLTLLLGQAEKI